MLREGERYVQAVTRRKLTGKKRERKRYIETEEIEREDRVKDAF